MLLGVVSLKKRLHCLFFCCALSLLPIACCAVHFPSFILALCAGSPLSRAQFLKKFPLLFPALRLLSKNVHLLG